MAQQKSSYRAIGIMSGTSLDGLDLACCFFTVDEGKWHFKIEAATTIAYSRNWIEQLRRAENNPDVSKIDITFGKYIAHCIVEFMGSHKLKPVDLICSHGHTLFHEPENGITVQVGSGKAIFDKTQITTISNFREQDVKLGGQGAPLVPIGDALLFPNFPICLNLGGFANLSLKSSGHITAWDICPVNYVLNALCSNLGLSYDNGGEIAAVSGTSTKLLDELNGIKYYSENPPKSLSREWVNQNILPILNRYHCTTEEKIATFTEHASFQIAKSLKSNSKVLVTGGGAYNKHLIRQIQYYAKDVEIKLAESELIEFKEALIFAFLGVLRLRNDINILASVTGAKRNHSSGDIYGVLE